MTRPSVVEVGRRGKLLSGEPYFAPGVPIVLDTKGPAGACGRAISPSSGRTRPRARRARPRERGRIENVLEALLVENGALRHVRAVRRADAEPRRPRRPSRADDDHDRPRHRQGLRRRPLVPPRARGNPCVGPHRRRLVLRARPARRSTSAPPSARSRPTFRASSRPCCRTSSPTTRARCARTWTASASRSRCRLAASRSSTAR